MHMYVTFKILRDNAYEKSQIFKNNFVIDVIRCFDICN